MAIKHKFKQMATLINKEVIFPTQKCGNLGNVDCEISNDGDSVGTLNTIETNTSAMEEILDETIFDDPDVDWNNILNETPNIQENLQNQNQSDTMDVLETCFVEDIQDMFVPGNKQTRVKYTKWAMTFLKYTKDNCFQGSDKPFTEDNVCSFFYDGLRQKWFGLGSVWTI